MCRFRGFTSPENGESRRGQQHRVLGHLCRSRSFAPGLAVGCSHSGGRQTLPSHRSAQKRLQNLPRLAAASWSKEGWPTPWGGWGTGCRVQDPEPRGSSQQWLRSQEEPFVPQPQPLWQ